MECRICKKNSVAELINFGMQPIVHNLKKHTTDKESLYSFRLGSCKKCGFLQLMDYIDPSMFYQNYSTLSSWQNQPHVDRLIDVMEALSGIDSNSRIIEIGCNDGSFLCKLRENNYSNIQGVEPTKNAYAIAKEKLLNVDNTFFTEQNAKNSYEKNTFDIVITRHLSEHISNLDDFLKGIHFILNDNTLLVIEIPDAKQNLESLDYSLWEEHVNYFTLETVESILNKHNLFIVHHETTLCLGRALSVFCQKKVSNRIVNCEKPDRLIYKYTNSWSKFKANLYSFLKSQDKPIAIYGCETRLSAFVNLTDIGSLVEVLIDDQKEKQNLFLPGSNLEITPWKEEYKNYLILLGVNAENEFKVINKRKLDYNNTFSISPPSKLLPSFWQDMINI